MYNKLQLHVQQTMIMSCGVFLLFFFKLEFTVLVPECLLKVVIKLMSSSFENYFSMFSFRLLNNNRSSLLFIPMYQRLIVVQALGFIIRL